MGTGIKIISTIDFPTDILLNDYIFNKFKNSFDFEIFLMGADIQINNINQNEKQK